MLRFFSCKSPRLRMHIKSKDGYLLVESQTEPTIPLLLTVFGPPERRSSSQPEFIVKISFVNSDQSLFELFYFGFIQTRKCVVFEINGKRNMFCHMQFFKEICIASIHSWLKETRSDNYPNCHSETKEWVPEFKNPFSAA